MQLIQMAAGKSNEQQTCSCLCFLSEDPGMDRITVRYRGRGLEPVYSTEHASGADLYACVDKPVDIEPFQRALIPTGVFSIFRLVMKGRFVPVPDLHLTMELQFSTLREL